MATKASDINAINDDDGLQGWMPPLDVWHGASGLSAKKAPLLASIVAD
jgi:hypothetical protein